MITYEPPDGRDHRRRQFDTNSTEQRKVEKNDDFNYFNDFNNFNDLNDFNDSQGNCQMDRDLFLYPNTIALN